MQVQPVEHPSIMRAVGRIYNVNFPIRGDLWNVFKLTRQDRGLLGFFSGSSLRIIRKGASSAVAWTVYESLLLFLRDGKFM
jgi:solute carrier family 25 protein 38